MSDFSHRKRSNFLLVERAKLAFVDGLCSNVSKEHGLSVTKRRFQMEIKRQNTVRHTLRDRKKKHLIVCYEPSNATKREQMQAEIVIVRYFKLEATDIPRLVCKRRVVPLPYKS